MSLQRLPANFHLEFEESLRKPFNKETLLFQPTLPLTPPPDEDCDSFLDVDDLPIPPLDYCGLESPRPDVLVAVIGVGYVGSHLVEAFARVYNILAFDVSETRLREVAGRFQGLPVSLTSRPSDLAAANYILVSVPTILNEDKTIDTTYLRSAVSNIAQYAQPGATVIVESSVAVGMTRELFGPLMASRGLKVCMSPERVDPGRTFPAFETIPKVISGLDNASLESISDLYGRVFDRLVPVSSPEVAEMTKLYENCQRMVCAAYANEMADACNELGIDAWEVSEAAASKPFGYLPFRPGPGVGGHCIPVNPYYLLATCQMPILQHAAERSWQRPAEVATRFMRTLLKGRSSSSTTTGAARRQTKPRVLVVGVGFKRGQSVLSNSPGKAIMVSLLSEWEDVYVEFADPLVGADAIPYVPRMNTAIDWNRDYLEQFSGIIVAVNQVGLDMEVLKTLRGVLVHNYCPS